jgi:hypothetical protein
MHTTMKRNEKGVERPEAVRAWLDPFSTVDRGGKGKNTHQEADLWWTRHPIIVERRLNLAGASFPERPGVASRYDASVKPIAGGCRRATVIVRFAEKRMPG